MCPVCREPMAAFELEGVEIDRCVACGGTWLDTGELEHVAELAGAGAGALSRALGKAGSGKHGKRRCPRCRRRLRRVDVGGEPPLEIDRCPGSHGLWFDAGEMRALIESFGEGEEGAVARFFHELYRGEVTGEKEGG